MQQWLSYIEALNLGQQKARQIASCHGYVSQFRYLKSLKSRPQKCVISSGNLIPLFRTLSLDLLGGRHTGVTRLIELETQKLLEVRHQGYVDGTKIKGFSEWKALVIIYIHIYLTEVYIWKKSKKSIFVLWICFSLLLVGTSGIWCLSKGFTSVDHQHVIGLEIFFPFEFVSTKKIPRKRNTVKIMVWSAQIAHERRFS